MSEKIILHHISDLSVPIILAREIFYAERYTTYRDHYVSFVDAMIFTPRGELILQRRALHKKVSPGLLHTTIGGHINPGVDIGFTIVHECMEEFGHPSYVVPDSMDFDTVYQKMKPYNDRLVIMKMMQKWTYEFDHHVGDEVFLARDITYGFVGVFAGIPRNLDNSVSEFVTLSLEEIDARLLCGEHDFTNSFEAQYGQSRGRLYDFRDVLLS